jgi:hypothetical protein
LFVRTHDGFLKSYIYLKSSPDANSCVGCFEADIGCSHTDDYTSFPCDNCEDKGEECVLIWKPVRRCTACKRIIGENRKTLCEECAGSNLPKGQTRTTKAVSAKPKPAGTRKVPFPKKLRKFVHCVACRTAKVKCSIKDVFDNGPCKRCVAESRRCFFDAHKKATFPTNLNIHGQPRAKRQRGQRLKKKIQSKKKRAPDSPEPKDPRGKIIKLTTSYCHPIAFNWVLPAPDPPAPVIKLPCHFCTDPGLPYALVGLGTQEVEVLERKEKPGFGYEELNGGWAAMGEEASRMCVPCTTERMLICTCVDHQIRRIAGLDPETFDIEAALRGVVERMLKKKKREKDAVVAGDSTKWCSICIMPAFYECCTKPAVDRHGCPTTPEQDLGCGLLLCEVCALRMTGLRSWDHGGDMTKRGGGIKAVKAKVSLDQHIAAATNDDFNYPDGLRADAGLLSGEGELMKRFVAELSGLSVEDKKDVAPSGEPKDDRAARRDIRKLKKQLWGSQEFIELID